MYELFLCIGISVLGCGGVQVHQVESKAECLELLREVKFQRKGEMVTGEDTTEVMAYCRPSRRRSNYGQTRTHPARRRKCEAG